MSDGKTPEGFNNHNLADILKKIEETLTRMKVNKDKINEIKERNMNEDPNGMVWFSASPSEYEFPHNPPTVWGGEVAEGSVPPPMRISPDLASFMVDAGLLLYDALYTPLRPGRGRLTDLFGWVERARDRMEQEDFSEEDRAAYEHWCRSVAETLLTAQKKHGLWLTDDEESLVGVMHEGIFNDHPGAGGAD